MSEEIVLYDLPVIRDGKYACFSPNTWKTRAVLNFKNIPYKTRWIEYSDLEPELKALGVPPNPPGSFADYTSPTIRLPAGTFVSDSARIAAKLEQLHPSPSLHLEAGIHDEIAAVCETAFFAVVFDCLPTLLTILPDRSSSWFAEDRERRFGASIGDLKGKLGGEGAWRKAEEPGGAFEKLREVMVMYRRDGGRGSFVLGEEPSYGDLIVAGLLECFKAVDEEAYGRLIGFDEVFARLHSACGKWVKRSDY